MRELELWVTNEGLRAAKVGAGETLQSLADRERLTAFEFSVGNKPIDRSSWSTYVLDGVTEIWASLGVKGA